MQAPDNIQATGLGAIREGGRGFAASVTETAAYPGPEVGPVNNGTARLASQRGREPARNATRVAEAAASFRPGRRPALDDATRLASRWRWELAQSTGNDSTRTLPGRPLVDARATQRGQGERVGSTDNRPQRVRPGSSPALDQTARPLASRWRERAPGVSCHCPHMRTMGDSSTRRRAVREGGCGFASSVPHTGANFGPWMRAPDHSAARLRAVRERYAGFAGTKGTAIAHNGAADLRATAAQNHPTGRAAQRRREWRGKMSSDRTGMVLRWPLGNRTANNSVSDDRRDSQSRPHRPGRAAPNDRRFILGNTWLERPIGKRQARFATRKQALASQPCPGVRSLGDKPAGLAASRWREWRGKVGGNSTGALLRLARVDILPCCRGDDGRDNRRQEASDYGPDRPAVDNKTARWLPIEQGRIAWLAYPAHPAQRCGQDTPVCLRPVRHGASTAFQLAAGCAAAHVRPYRTTP